MTDWTKIWLIDWTKIWLNNYKNLKLITHVGKNQLLRTHKSSIIDSTSHIIFTRYST